MDQIAAIMGHSIPFLSAPQTPSLPTSSQLKCAIELTAQFLNREHPSTPTLKSKRRRVDAGMSLALPGQPSQQTTDLGLVHSSVSLVFYLSEVDAHNRYPRLNSNNVDYGTDVRIASRAHTDIWLIQQRDVRGNCACQITYVAPEFPAFSSFHHLPHFSSLSCLDSVLIIPCLHIPFLDTKSMAISEGDLPS